MIVFQICFGSTFGILGHPLSVGITDDAHQVYAKTNFGAAIMSSDPDSSAGLLTDLGYLRILATRRKRGRKRGLRYWVFSWKDWSERATASAWEMRQRG